MPMADQGGRICIFLIIGVCALLLVILLPLSFSTVEYYEYGLKKRKSTGFVSTGADDEVYTYGRYAIGPDHTFKKFRADAHFELLENIDVFTSDKVEVTLTFAFQYFLFKKDLKDLHNEYDLFYKPVVRSKAIDAVKGEAAKQSVQSYLNKREEIENILGKALKLRLEGRCCRENCGRCRVDNCIEYSLCKKSDKGLFVEVRYYQLLEVDIHSEVKKQYLKKVTELAEEERAEFVLQEQVVRKKTEQEKNKIYNEAREIYQNATAKSEVIIATAKGQALRRVENQRADSLKELFTLIGFGQDGLKASFSYIRALRESKKKTLYYNFASLQAKP